MSAKTTLYVIAYDITNNRRRTKVHKALCGFGRWTQYSLFECFLTPRQRIQLRQRLDDLIDPTEDSVRVYPLCTACVERTETVGAPPPEDPDLFLI
jgi:CRISPR-associated protein Cas2